MDKWIKRLGWGGVVVSSTITGFSRYLDFKDAQALGLSADTWLSIGLGIFIICIIALLLWWQKELGDIRATVTKETSEDSRLETLQAQWAEQERIVKRKATSDRRAHILKGFNNLLDAIMARMPYVLEYAKIQLSTNKELLTEIWQEVQGERQSMREDLGQFRWLLSLRNSMYNHSISLVQFIQDDPQIKQLNIKIDNKLRALGDDKLYTEIRELRGLIEAVYDNHLFAHFQSKAGMGDKYHDIDVDAALKDYLETRRVKISERIQYLLNAEDVI